jgi:hypothetical protein
MPRHNKKRSYGRVPRGLALQVHRFCRTVSTQFGVNSYQGFTSASGAINIGNGIGIAYSLAGVNISGTATSITIPMTDVGEFTSLFDQYKIVGVRSRWIWTNNVSNGSAAPGTFTGIGNPVVQSSFDYDDSLPPGSQTVLLEREDTRFWTFDTNGPKTFSIRPKLLTGVLSGASVVAAESSSGGWVNTSTTGVLYYGHKMWMEPLSTPTTQLQTGYLFVYFTVDFEFRTAK